MGARPRMPIIMAMIMMMPEKIFFIPLLDLGYLTPVRKTCQAKN
jgi:hypothetical protein